MIRRDLERYSSYTVRPYRSIAHFCSVPPSPGVATLDYNGSPLDLLFRLTPGSDTAIVSFHAALQPGASTRPVFTGVGVTAGLAAHQLFVSDPSLELDDSLLLAWFAGNLRQDLQRDLRVVLEHVVASLGVRNLIFFGPSGGGFAALYYSWWFPGSLAVASNPQVVLSRYEPRRHLATFGRVCFDASTPVELERALNDRFMSDLRTQYGKGFTNSVAYLQNTSDLHHVGEHMVPFFSDVSTSPDTYVFLGQWGPGHAAPPRDFVSTLLARAVASGGAWHRALDAPGFIRGDDIRELIGRLRLDPQV